MKLYAERDAIRQGQHYVRHVEAMTAEGLHSKADIAAELAHRDILIESLRSTIDDLTAGEIHTCHDHCQRTACILRRENDALRSRLADIESQNRVMWDVANDREARLAEAERQNADLAIMVRRLVLRLPTDDIIGGQAMILLTKQSRQGNPLRATDSASHRENDSHD